MIFIRACVYPTDTIIFEYGNITNMLRYIVLATMVLVTKSYHVAVVGGGPAGILSAIALARKGNRVSIFEQRLGDQVDGSRNYNLLLSERGRNALDRFDVDYKHTSVVVKNVVRHVNGNNKPDIIQCDPSVSIARNDLLECLRSTAKTWGIHMEKSLFYDMDIDKKQILTDNGEVKYDLLVGADGANSRMRSMLDKHITEFSFKEEKDDRLFKTFRVSEREMNALDGYEDSWKGSFHVWQGSTSDVICPPTAHGGLTGTYVSQTENFDLSRHSGIFDKLDVVQRRNLVENQPNRQKYIYCSHVGIGNAILVGDAAHSMPASLGQGVNSALEDAVCLDRCLAIRLHVDEMVHTYNNSRIKDAHAVCDLSKKAFGNGDRSNRGAGGNKMMMYLGRPDISYSDILSFTSD